MQQRTIYSLYIIFFFLCLPFFSFALTGIERIEGNIYKVPLDKYDLRVWTGSPIGKVKEQTERLGGELGINGGFFCPAEKAYSRCTPNATDNERIVAGVPYSLHSGDMADRAVFGVDASGQALLVQASSWQWSSNINSGRLQDVTYGLANFPVLLANGEDQLENYDLARIGYAKNTQPMTRAFICTPVSGAVVFVGYTPKLTIYELPSYLRDTLGCYDALNLDAGYSAALYYQGKYKIGPGRDVTDGYVFVPKDTRVEQQLAQYVMTKAEGRAALRLYKRTSREITKGIKTKAEALAILHIFESSDLMKKDLPRRAMYRAVIGLLSKE